VELADAYRVLEMPKVHGETVRATCSPDHERNPTMSVVRISKGTFDPSRLAEAERRLAESESALRDTLANLEGLVHYYVGIDRAQSSVTNVSIWDSMEHARQMDTLAVMLAQRPILEAAGVTFETITNHETLWVITP
jgi:hypothetical protein